MSLNDVLMECQPTDRAVHSLQSSVGGVARVEGGGGGGVARVEGGRGGGVRG